MALETPAGTPQQEAPPEPSPFEGRTPVPSLAQLDGTVTLVEGQTFCLSGRTGDLLPDFVGGLFYLDTRILSRWELRVNGDRLEPLTVDVTEPFAATFLGRVTSPAGKADAETVAYRHRSIGSGMRERIVLVHHGLEPTPVVVELTCDVDFAGLFEVKESRVRSRDRRVDAAASGVRFDLVEGEVDKSVRLTFSEPASVENGVVTWRGELAPRQSWELCVEVVVALAGDEVAPRFRCGDDDVEALPAQRLASWRATLPVIDTDSAGMALAVRRAGEDLGSLRIFDPEHPETPILAAGAPWFMTLFGRDSLLDRLDDLAGRPDPGARRPRDARPVAGRGRGPGNRGRAWADPPRGALRRIVRAPRCVAATSTSGRSTRPRCS